MDKKIQVVLFDEEELSKTLIESYFQEVTFPHDVLRFNSFDGALIPSTDEKKLIIVNISNFNTSVLSEIAKFSQDTNNLFLIISYGAFSENSASYSFALLLMPEPCNILRKPS